MASVNFPAEDLSNITIDSIINKPFLRRKISKNPPQGHKKTELKVVTLGQKINPKNNKNNRLMSLDALQECCSNLIKRNKHTHQTKKFQVFVQDKKASYSKQSSKARYQQLYSNSINSLFKNTIHIGPFTKSIFQCEDLNDPYCNNKLINIEKISFPIKQVRRQTVSQYQKYKHLMNKTSRNSLDQQKITNKTFKSIIDGRKSRQQQSKISDEPEFEITEQEEFKKQSMDKKDLKDLIPVRKPSTKKDYFVFGLSDRASSTENKIQYYRDFLWKINYSNGLYVYTPQSLPTSYKFYIGDGNNSNLIRSLMRRRFWWGQAASKNESGINFCWSQLKINSLFSNQDNGNIQQYLVIERISTEQKSKKVETVPIANEIDDSNKKILGKLDYKIWKNHYVKNEKTEKKISEATYKKRIKLYEKKRIEKIEDSKGILVHNHLESNFYIGNKKALFYNLKRYLELKGLDPFQVLPMTFHISKGTEDPEYHRFIKYYEKFQEQKKETKNKNIWIVKPGENTNRGNGITVCFNIDDIKIRLKGRERNGDGKLRTFILQKYIENPMLYNKRKFDIRHYMLVTCVNGSFKGYWYEEGYIRTSSSEFNTKASKDPIIHLTNDAIQKHTSEYGKYQKANKLSYCDFQKYLETTYPSKKYNFFEQMIPKMKLFGTESVKATYSILDPTRKRHNFELLGLDFMIDDNFQPWLIEVNTNPCLELCCPLLSKIIPGLIENTLRICVDPLFPPAENWPNNRKPFFGEDSLNQNKFEIVFDESSQGKQIDKLYHGQERIDLKMGRIEQDNQTFENDGELQWEKQ